MAAPPQINFLILHYAYFIITCVTSSVIFYLITTAPYRVTYVDSLFMCISAMTGTGFNVVTIS